MAEPLTGGCQCGAVRYEITAPPRRVLACHCTDCQRQSGSAYGLAMWVAEGDFRFTRGEPRFYEWRSAADRGKGAAFCGACGVRLYHANEWQPGTLAVKPGTLDDTGGFTPDLHIWTGSKQPWVVIPEDVASHEGQP